jgi:hypothetical protein
MKPMLKHASAQKPASSPGRIGSYRRKSSIQEDRESHKDPAKIRVKRALGHLLLPTLLRHRVGTRAAGDVAANLVDSLRTKAKTKLRHKSKTSALGDAAPRGR